MYSSKNYRQKYSRITFGLILFCLMFTLGIPVTGVVAQPTQTITGRVYRDYNINGVQDALEPGVGGIDVNVYGAAGTPLTAQVTTDFVPATLGDYSITWPGTETHVRLEFSGLPTSLEAGAFGSASGTSVQFVDAGTVANYGVNNPSQFCDNNPKLSTSCYVFGDQVNGANSTLPAIISFDYSSTGTPANETTLATASQVGATYGLAEQARTNSVFAAAFVKRHVSLVSTNNLSGNPGVIYKISGGTVTPYITLAAGTDPHTPTNVTPAEPDYFDDLGAFDAVGRVGLADIDLSNDENQLYVINLSTKQLQIVNATGATGTLIGSRNLPQPASCAPADTIPGALKVYDNVVYVGITCTGPTIADLQAYIYRFAGGAFSGPVAQFPLNYPRGYASTDGTITCPTFPSASVYSPTHCVPANWQPWTTTTASYFDGPFGQKIYPQPWLLDIEIDEYGFLIANFADRMGHQAGNNPGTNSGPVEGVSAGDMLRLTPNSYPVSTTTWTLENDADAGNGIPGGAITAGHNGQGPGGGEFYHRDAYTLAGRDIHQEIYLGGLALVYGSGEIATAAFDPTVDLRSGGLIVSSNSLGTKLRGIEIFGQDSVGTFGKAAGIGDIEIRCSSAPIEIGNYVWFDANKNGIQDPDETPIPGVDVELFDPASGLVIATATTDANGQYIFSSSPINVNPGSTAFVYGVPIAENTNYIVRVLTTQPPLVTFTTTFPTVTGGLTPTVRDSNGVYNPLTKYSVATVTTGIAGQNNHTLDFGFYVGVPVLTPTPSTPPAPGTPSVGLTPIITKEVDPPFAQPGDQVRWTIGITNPHAVAIPNVSFVDNFPSELEVISATADTAGGTLTVTGNTVSYNIPVLNPGQTIKITVLTRIKLGTPVPFIITNTVNLTGAYVGSASATVLSAGTLPATGFEPPWRVPLLLGLCLIVVLFGFGIYRLRQRRTLS